MSFTSLRSFWISSRGRAPTKTYHPLVTTTSRRTLCSTWSPPCLASWMCRAAKTSHFTSWRVSESYISSEFQSLFSFSSRCSFKSIRRKGRMIWQASVLSSFMWSISATAAPVSLFSLERKRIARMPGLRTALLPGFTKLTPTSPTKTIHPSTSLPFTGSSRSSQL